MGSSLSLPLINQLPQHLFHQHPPFSFTNFRFSASIMKFSTTTVIVAATLGLAAPAFQQDASNSDFIYQLQVSDKNNQFNQQLFTDGTNIYYGPRNQNTAPQGQNLVTITVFMDSNGNLQSIDNQNRYVSVGSNGRMQMSNQHRGRWNVQTNRNNNNDVSLRFDNNPKFLACPVQNYNSGSRSRGKREESESAAARKDHQNNWNNNQNWNNQNGQKDNQVYQVYVNNAPCANPVELSLNGQKRGRRNQWNNRNNRNVARDVSTETPEATIVLRVNGVTRQNAMYSPVFNQDGRMYTQMQRDNHHFSDDQHGNNMFRLSQDGQIIDTRSQQYARLGQNQQLSMTNNQNQGLLFTVDINGNLQYNGNQFLACDTGNNGLYEVRPAGAEGAAASCANAQAITIQIDQQ
ncbi:uncharacterized protein YALI1_F26757g [Yarrowia lipolytica]|nr:hypothetical protein YALI1_F26757g [Yarrowia lipolytica]